MPDFFRNLFGGWSRSQDGKQEKLSEDRSFDGSPRADRERDDAQLAEVRKGKFRSMLDALVATPLDDGQFARAVQELCRMEKLPGDGPFPSISADEMSVRARKIAKELFADNVPPKTYNPAEDAYDKMGTPNDMGTRRRVLFEQAFAARLGRPVTPRDMETARSLFEIDEKMQQQWPTLEGEKVAQYGRAMAERILRLQDAQQDAAAAK